MKHLILILLMAIVTLGYSQGEVRKDYHLTDNVIPTFAGDTDTSYILNITSPYAYSYAVKWDNLDVTTSYVSIHLGVDPDGDGTLDWVRDTTIDSLQLTPAAGGTSIITNIANWITVRAIKVNYNHSTCTTGTIDISLDLITKK